LKTLGLIGSRASRERVKDISYSKYVRYTGVYSFMGPMFSDDVLFKSPHTIVLALSVYHGTIRDATQPYVVYRWERCKVIDEEGPPNI
jgi:hypothetical protein